MGQKNTNRRICVLKDRFTGSIYCFGAIIFRSVKASVDTPKNLCPKAVESYLSGFSRITVHQLFIDLLGLTNIAH